LAAAVASFFGCGDDGVWGCFFLGQQQRQKLDNQLPWLWQPMCGKQKTVKQGSL